MIWAVLGLYLCVAILINIPVVQSFLGAQVASALSQKLNTKVWLGRVDLGLLNRIIIDDVKLLDQKDKELLRASRLSAKFDYIELIQGRIAITSAQLFGMKANLYQEDARSKPNFQFVLDSLASKDTTRHKPLYLELKSLIIRHGEIRYNRWDMPVKRQFDPNHLQWQGSNSDYRTRSWDLHFPWTFKNSGSGKNFVYADVSCCIRGDFDRNRQLVLLVSYKRWTASAFRW